MAEYADFRSILGNRAAANRIERGNAIEFLSDMGGRNGFPRIFALEENADEVWLLREKIPGRLLGSRLPVRDFCDAREVIRQALESMVLLEEAGFCHRDFGVWNVRYDEGEKRVYLAGYGAIEHSKGDEKGRPHPVPAFLSFMCHVLGDNRDPGALRNPRMLTHLKEYLSDRQYAELSKLRGKEISFRRLKEILFSGKGSERPYAYNLRDLELMELCNMTVETKRDWEALKPVLVDRINMLLEYRRISADHINRLNRMMAEQQERLRKLEQLVKEKE